jgi:hypothetical protein
MTCTCTCSTAVYRCMCTVCKVHAMIPEWLLLAKGYDVGILRSLNLVCMVEVCVLFGPTIQFLPCSVLREWGVHIMYTNRGMWVGARVSVVMLQLVYICVRGSMHAWAMSTCPPRVNACIGWLVGGMYCASVVSGYVNRREWVERDNYR